MADSRESNSPIEQPAVRTTIVGGRPPGSGKGIGQVPRGIEVLIKKAAVDAEFRELLLSKRAAAADEIGLRLLPAEAAMLDAAPRQQLELVIAQTKVDPAVRPALLGKVAAAMLMAMGLVVGADGCGFQSFGHTPKDYPPPRPPASQPADPLPLGDFSTGRPGGLLAAGDEQPIQVPVAGVAPGPIVRPTPPAPTSQPTNRPVSTTQVDELVAQLDSKNFATRDRAEQQLRQFDPTAVLLRLRELLKSEKLSTEAEMRLKEIVKLPEEVETLIGRLDADEVVTIAGYTTGLHLPVYVTDAERRLTEIGPFAISQLKVALASKKLSPDATERATRTIAAIEQRQATSQPAREMPAGSGQEMAGARPH